MGGRSPRLCITLTGAIEESSRDGHCEHSDFDNHVVAIMKINGCNCNRSLCHSPSYHCARDRLLHGKMRAAQQ